MNAGTSVTIAGSGIGGNAINVSSSTGTGGTVLVTAPTSIAMTALGGANIAANGANGGTITFTANAGTISTFDGVSARGGLSATGSGHFNRGGTVTLTSQQDTTIGTVDVSGVDLGSGGTISLTNCRVVLTYRLIARLTSD